MPEKRTHEIEGIVRAAVFGSFGIEDNEEGRKSMRALGDFASLLKDFNGELRGRAIKGSLSFIGWVLKLSVIGAVAYIVLKIGCVNVVKP